jgi:3-hydroxyacyl-[acyl-carrier-protein] dehydratase
MTVLLLNHFYKIDTLQKENNSISATITFDTGHPIFEGHFPDRPIVPGVCQTQMLTEVIDQALSLNLSLKSAASIKFLSVVDPTKNPSLNLIISFVKTQEDSYSVTAQYKWDDTIFFKFKGVFAAGK